MVMSLFTLWLIDYLIDYLFLFLFFWKVYFTKHVIFGICVSNFDIIFSYTVLCKKKKKSNLD